MVDLPLTGRCLCGAVRFEVTEPPVSASYCHCTRCQRRTGTAASVNARVAPGSVRVTAGEEHVRCWQPEDGAGKCFCSECGGAVWSLSDDGSVRGIRFSAFDGDPGIRPSYRQYVAYAAEWEPIPDDGLPRYPEAKPA